MAPLPRLRRLSRLAPLALAAALPAAACGADDEAAGDGAGCEALAAPVSSPAPDLASAVDEWPSANRNLAGDRTVLGGPIRAATAARLETAWEYWPATRSSCPSASATRRASWRCARARDRAPAPVIARRRR